MNFLAGKAHFDHRKSTAPVGFKPRNGCFAYRFRINAGIVEQDFIKSQLAPVVAAIGLALVGRVILLRPALRAPFSQRDCAAFRGVQSQYVDTGGMGGNAERGRTEALSDFELEEKTGRARVAMSVGTIVEAKDVKVGNDGEWECYEWALTEGTRVCVIGVARWEQGATLDGPSSGTPPLVGRPFREAPRRLRIEAESLFPF